MGLLLPQISSAKINIQYAKAKESEGKYEEAAKAFETAKDFENIIRINLEHLNNPGNLITSKAFSVIYLVVLQIYAPIVLYILQREVLKWYSKRKA